MKQSVTSLITAGVFAATLGGNAFAAEGGPSDAEIMSAKTVGVSPVLATGISRDSAWQSVGQSLTVAHEARGEAGVHTSDVIQLDADGGFGFAGSSSTSDLFVLHYGLLLGSFATNQGDAKAMADAVGMLEAGRQHLASLTPAALAAIDKFIAAARGGEVSGAALAQILASAERGIAEGDQRAHGYLASGVWLGLSVIVASAGGGNATFTGMAEPLAVMLDEDASFGGSDRRIAEQLRAAARTLQTNPSDVAAVVKILEATMKIQADSETEPKAGGDTGVIE